MNGENQYFRFRFFVANLPCYVQAKIYVALILLHFEGIRSIFSPNISEDQKNNVLPDICCFFLPNKVVGVVVVVVVAVVAIVSIVALVVYGHSTYCTMLNQFPTVKSVISQ